jgi:hypothetical protein
MQPWLLTLALILKLEINEKIGVGVVVWVWVWLWLCGCGFVGVGVLDIHDSLKVKSNLSHDCLVWLVVLTIIFDSKFFPSLESLIDNINCGHTFLAICVDCGANKRVAHWEAMWLPAGPLRGGGATREKATTSPLWQPASALRGCGASRREAMWHNSSKIAMDKGGDSAMDGEMVAWLQWVMVRWWVIEGVKMGDGNSGSKIAMGNNNGSAMVMAAQLWWQSPWMAVAAIGDSNGGSMIAMGNSGCIAMDNKMAAQSLCVALQLQWTVAAVIGDG